MEQAPNYTELEIELAYLPKQLPEDLLSGTPVRIVDIYLSEENDLLTKLRLRQKGSTYEITKKTNTDANDLSVQEEYTIPLSENEFNTLRSAGGREIMKDRYLVPLGKHVMEVDVFLGALEGLILIEVEFSGRAERNAFTPPQFFGRDVTQENFIAGAFLAGKSLRDIQPELDRLSSD